MEDTRGLWEVVRDLPDLLVTSGDLRLVMSDLRDLQVRLGDLWGPRETSGDL